MTYGSILERKNRPRPCQLSRSLIRLAILLRLIVARIQSLQFCTDLKTSVLPTCGKYYVSDKLVDQQVHVVEIKIRFCLLRKYIIVI